MADHGNDMVTLLEWIDVLIHSKPVDVLPYANADESPETQQYFAQLNQLIDLTNLPTPLIGNDAWLQDNDPPFTRGLFARCQGIGDSDTPCSTEHIWFIKQSYEFTEIVRLLLKAPAQTALAFHHTKAFLTLLKVLQWTTWFWTLKPTKLATLVHGDLMESTYELLLAICTRRNCAMVLKWCDLLSRLTTCNPKKHDASKLKRIAEEMHALSIEFNKEHQVVDRQIPLDNIENMNQAIMAYYLRTRVDETDEALRKAVVEELQHHVKKYFDSKCKLYLYGSSLSLFGSKGCDIDITVVRKKPPPSHHGIGQARRNYEDALKASDLGTRCAEVLHQIKSDCEKAMAAHAKILEKCPKDSTKMPDKLRNQFKRSEFFCNSLKHLVTVTEELAQTAPSERGSLASMKEYLRAAIAEAEAQRKVMYKLSNALTAGGCTIQQMILGARVPIIKFVHDHTAFECDICIGNTLPTKNTMLLRTYGMYDPRVRPLILSVKRWAKARHINDASMGTLSSYSYALLAIHVLQQYGVVPNLQDPELLDKLKVPRETLNEHDVSFCSNIEKLKTAVRLPNTSHLSIAELLQKFFCYLHNFDWRDQTIAIHRKESMTKEARWGANMRTWRMSIEDPFELERDLGVVLQTGGQQKIIQEIERAMDILSSEGSTFEDLVSDAPKPLSKKEKKEAARAARKEERKAKKVVENKPNTTPKKHAPGHHQNSEKKVGVESTAHSKPKHNHIIAHSPTKKKALPKDLATKEFKPKATAMHSVSPVASANQSPDPVPPAPEGKKIKQPKKAQEDIAPPPAPSKSLFPAPQENKAKKNKWRKKKQPAKD